MFSGIDDPTRWVLPDVLTEMATRRPDAEWVSDSHGDTMTFAQAQSQALQAASFLAGLGIVRGQRAGLLLHNGCDFLRAWMGLGKLGATAVLFNTELHGRFLAYQLADSQVQCLVVEADLVPVLEQLDADLPDLTTLVVVGEPPSRAPRGLRIVDWREHRSAPEWSGPGPGPADVFCIMYTSGTSGPSKGVLMPHAHCTLYGVGTIDCLALGADDRYYVCLPLFHANGLLMQVGATLLAGIPAFVRTRFSATSWLSDLRTHRATVTNHLGATAAFVIAQPPTDRDRDHRLRAVLPAPNLPQHEQQFRERFGVRDVVSGFGMTEVNIPIWGRLGCPAPGAAGWVHDRHFEVCIADPETDQPLGRGQMGEILVRPRIPFGFMAGYLNAPQKTVEAWRNLWFHTGDAGIMDDSGLVTFVDRIKDCIRRRGQNISASEVESVVLELPGIVEVAAYAVPSDTPGAEDEVMLAVVPQAGAPIDCLLLARQAGERLPRFAQPRYVKLLDQLPKTATGKVQRAVLRKQGARDAVDTTAHSLTAPVIPAT